MVRTLKLVPLALFVAALVALGPAPVSAQTTKCTVAKIKAAAKKGLGKAKCYAKAVGKNVPVDSACVAKAEVKFSSTFAKTEAKSQPCLTNGDAPMEEAKIDALIADISAVLGGPGPGLSKCSSKKYSEAGKKFSKKTGCYAKAVMKSVPVDSTCIAKAEVKFSSAVAKAEAKVPNDCLTTGDAASVEALVDAVVADTVAELGVECAPAAAPFARAATIASSADLVSGPLARGQIGDFILENDQIRLVIQQPGRVQFGVGTFGGNIIDGDLRRSCGNEHDSFEELAPLLNIENTANYTGVTILNDGTNSLPAVIRFTGPDDLLDFINPSSTVASFGFTFPAAQDDTNLNATFQTDYTLEAGKPYVKIETTVTNTGGTPINTFFGDIMNGSGQVEEFEPGNGFGEPLVTTACATSTHVPCTAGMCDPCDYVAWTGEDLATGRTYGYIHGVNGSSNFNTSGVTVSLHGVNVALVLVGLQPFNYTIAPLGSMVFTRYFAIGDASVGSIVDIRNSIRGFSTTGTLTGAVTSSGFPVSNADVAVLGTPYSAPIVGGPAKNVVDHFRTDGQGKYTGTLPAGSYTVRANKDGRLAATPDPAPVTIMSAMTTTQDFTLPTPGRLLVTVRDENSDPIPAKVQLVGLDATPTDAYNTQNVLTVIPTRTGVFGSEVSEADGLPYGIGFVTFANKDGQTGLSEVDPGSYQLVVSRGPRYSAFTQSVTITAGATTSVAAQIAKVIDTPGFITGDFHVHAINSPDSEVTNAERVATQMAEGTDFFTPSDHDFRTDFAPTIASMGVGSLIGTATSAEITTFDYGHFNSWPQPITGALNGGGVDFGRAGIAPGMDFPSLGSYNLTPAEIYTEAHLTPGALIQINHMRSHFNRDGLTIDTAESGTGPPTSHTPAAARRLDPGVGNLFSSGFDVLEVWIGTDGRGGDLNTFVGENLGDWFNMLNFGILRPGVADSDTHQRRETQINARTYVASAVTDPGLLSGVAPALAASVVAGKSIGTNAPFVTITAHADSTNEDGGLGVGDSNLVSTTDGIVEVTVTVKSPFWAEFDKIQFFVNAAPQPVDDDSDVATPPRYHALRTTGLACDPTYGCIEKVAPTDFTVTQVDDFPAIPGAKHWEATYLLNLTGITTDAWLIALVRGTDNVSHPLFPVNPSSIVPKACNNNLCRACTINADCPGGTCTGPSNQTLAELTDGNLNQCGSLSLAFTNPLYFDGDNDNVWTAPGVVLSPP